MLIAIDSYGGFRVSIFTDGRTVDSFFSSRVECEITHAFAVLIVGSLDIPTPATTLHGVRQEPK